MATSSVVSSSAGPPTRLSDLESQPLIITSRADEAAQIAARRTLFRIARDGFIMSSVGGGIGGAITRVTFSILKKALPTALTRGALGTIGGALLGASLGVGCYAAYVGTPFAAGSSTGDFFIISGSSVAGGSLLLAISTYIGGNPAASISLGSGIGSLIGLGIGGGLGAVVDLGGIAAGMGAIIGSAVPAMGLLSCCCIKPVEEEQAKAVK